MAKKDTKMETEEKKLTGEQKYRLLCVHLKDRNIQLEREVAALMAQVVQLKKEKVELESQLHENGEVKELFEELGIRRGEHIVLNDDGTLVVQRPTKRPEAATT